MRLIECVPNLSEGRDLGVIDRITQVVSQTKGIKLLHRTSDYDHNRSVLTFTGQANALREAVLIMYEEVANLIDMRDHQGEHPRIGAVDVCPFVPLGATKMTECRDLAEEVASIVGPKHALPVYLYEEAALHEERRRLENVRRGQYEGLERKLENAAWHPDFGPGEFNPRLGATIIGARKILIAYNVNLRSQDLGVAKKIAAAIRESSGGLRNVKALGINMAHLDKVQVSMNLTDYQATPIHRVFELIRAEAARYGVEVAESELIGLAPADAFLSAAAHYLHLEDFSEQRTLEYLIHASG